MGKVTTRVRFGGRIDGPSNVIGEWMDQKDENENGGMSDGSCIVRKILCSV